MKLRLVRALQRYVFNPPIKLLFRLGAVPPGYALLETIGRRSGRPRQTPVGDGLIGDTFWIVAEHGLRAAYVRNLQDNPRVRVRVRRGTRSLWLTGIAHVLPEDDARERQRQLSRTSLNRRLNAFVVRALGTELATVRIDLDGEDSVATQAGGMFWLSRKKWFGSYLRLSASRRSYLATP